MPATAIGSLRRGLSLLELVVVVSIIGILAVIVVPRFTNQGSQAKRNACFVHQGNIEIQCELWRRQKGSAPQANLGDIGANTTYFPDGLPKCPVDNTSYSINTSTLEVSGHAH